MCNRCLRLSRRGLLSALSATVLAAAGPKADATVSGDEAPHRLMEGNARYRANNVRMRDYAAGRASRVKVHRPLASLLSCADARVGPEFIFDQQPGDLFVVRVAGNVVHDDGVASLEYAAQFLASPLIFVLGHSQCGAVDAALKVVRDNAVLPGHLPGLIDQLKPATQVAQAKPLPTLLDAAIAENVRYSMRQITATQPLLSDMIAGGKVKIVGGVYDIATGRVNMV